MAKAAVLKSRCSFQPISIEVVLESQAEVDWFGTIFNYAPLCNLPLLRRDWCAPIRYAIREVGGNIDNTHELDRIIHQ